MSGVGLTEPPKERSARSPGKGAGTGLGERYEEHHRERRAEGDFVFVPERIPFFQRAIGRGRRVLDLGCRSGAFTRNFLDGNEVVGLDVDRVALAKAAELGVETVVANVEEPLPFPDASFDAVVAGELLEHLQFPSRARRGGETRSSLRRRFRGLRAERISPSKPAPIPARTCA